MSNHMEKIFPKGNYSIIHQDDYYKSHPLHRSQLSKLNNKYQFIVLAQFKKGTTERKKENVVARLAYTIEHDYLSKKLQAKMFKEMLGENTAWCVDSGNKSLHFSVVFSKPIAPDSPKDKELQKLLRIVFPFLDTSLIVEPHKLVRMPNGIRKIDRKKNITEEKPQKLISKSPKQNYNQFIKRLKKIANEISSPSKIIANPPSMMKMDFEEKTRDKDNKAIIHNIIQLIEHGYDLDNHHIKRCVDDMCKRISTTRKKCIDAAQKSIENKKQKELERQQELEKRKQSRPQSNPVAFQGEGHKRWIKSKLAQRDIVHDLQPLIQNCSDIKDCGNGNYENIRCVFPWHEDRTPSAFIKRNNEGVQYYFCNGSNCMKGNGDKPKDLLGLYMVIYNETFAQACIRAFGFSYKENCEICGESVLFDSMNKCYNLDEVTLHQCKKEARMTQQNERSVAPKKAAAPKEKEPELDELSEEKEHSLPKNLHPFFTEYLDSMHGCTDAPREYLACSLLSSLAAAIGNKAYINLGGGRLCPNLYMMLIGDSTFMRKSTSQKMGIKALKVIDNELKKDYEQQEKKYREDFEAWKETKEDNPPIKPQDQSVIYPNDFSIERLLQKMESRPDGILIYGEMGSLLAKMQKDLGLKEMMTDFYDFQERYIKETKNAGVNYLENVCLNLLGASTIEWLQKWLRKEDLMSGFLGRFCFCIRRKYPEGIAWPDPWKCDEKTTSIFRRLQTFPFHELQPSKDTKQAYTEWYNKFDNTAKAQDRLLHSFLGRLQTTCHKIAMIHHCLDFCSNHWSDGHHGGIWHPEVNTLKPESYKYAFDWIQFFANNIYSCYRDLVTDTSTERRVIEVTKKYGKDGRITLSALLKNTKMKKKDCLEVLENIEAKNYGRIERSGKYIYFRIKV